MEAILESFGVLVKISQVVMIVLIVSFYYTLLNCKTVVPCLKSVSGPKLAQRQLASCVFDFFCKSQQIRMQGLNKRLYMLLTHTMYYVYIPKDFYYSTGVPFSFPVMPTGCSEEVRAIRLLVNRSLGKLEWPDKKKGEHLLPKRSGMEQIEWPSKEYLDNLDA